MGGGLISRKRAIPDQILLVEGAILASYRSSFHY
jgi:hypothetical protein